MAELAAPVTRDRRAELLVCFFDANGSAVDFRRETVEVPMTASGDTTIAMPIPPGATVAEALLRVNGSLGFSKVPST